MIINYLVTGLMVDIIPNILVSIFPELRKSTNRGGSQPRNGAGRDVETERGTRSGEGNLG